MSEARRSRWGGGESTTAFSRLRRGFLASLLLLPLLAGLSIEASAQTVPVITIARDASLVTEGAAASFTLTATPAPASAITVNVRVADVAAANGDFVAAGNEGERTVEIPTSGAAAFTVATVSDSVYEAGGDLTATVAPGDSAVYTVGNPSSVSVAVADNDTPAVFWWGNAIRPEWSPDDDNSRHGFLALQVTRELGSALTFSYTLGGTATCGVDYDIDGADCDTGGGAFTLPAGTEAIDELVVFPIAVRDDTVADNGETVVVTVVDGVEYDLGSPSGATMTIYEDTGEAAYSIAGTPELGATLTVRQDRPDPDGDGAVTYQWWYQTEMSSAQRQMVGETAATLVVPAARKGDFLLVEVSHVDGNGFSSALETQTVGPVTEPQGHGVSDGTDPVTPAVDPALVAQVRGYAAETWEHPDHVDRWMRVLAAFGDDNGHTAMTAAEAQTHADKGWQRWVPVAAALAALEAAPEPPTLPAVSVSAGAGVTEGGDAAFTVTASPAPASPLAVSVTVATAGEFGVTAGSRPVTIPTTGSATLTLATANDEADEPDGSVTATVAAGAGYTVGSPASGTVAIADDDDAPVPEVTPLPEVTVSAGAGVTEGGDAAFTLTASPAPASELSVNVTVAADGDHGVTAGSQSVTIPATGSATLTLATVNDDADEPDGSASVTVAAGAGYTVGSPASGTVAIADDDAPLPEITVSAGAGVTEGGDAVFTLTASPAPASPLAVSVTVAADGDHGVAAGSRSVTIPTTGSATLTLATANDDADEPDGSASVTVNAGDGYTVGDPASGTVAVADDDEPAGITVSAADATAEEGGLMEFAVRLSAPADGTVRVRADTRDSSPVSARAPQDYWSEGKELVFGAGETERIFTVIVFEDDDRDEGSETFELALSNARGADIGAGVAVGTIVDAAPTGASVDRARLTLTWPEPRDGFGTPAGTDWAVAVDGVPRAVASATVAGRRAVLTLAAPVAPGDAVTVGYVGSAMHPLADAAGRRSAAWDGLPAVNVTRAPPPGGAGLAPEAPGTRVDAVRPAGADVARPPAAALAAVPAGAARLDASGLGLADLSALGRFSALARVDLSDNALAGLAGIEAHAGLRELDLSGNRIADLGPLAALSGLERLDLTGNRVADLAPLAGLPALRVLVLDGNAVSDLGPLTHHASLGQLGLADNAVADVTPLQDLPRLRRLDLGGNPAADLSPLGDVASLEWLALPGGRAAAEGALIRLTRLRWVWPGPAQAPAR